MDTKAAAARQIDADAIPDETLALINELIPGSTPWGAYAIGMVCSTVWMKSPSIKIPREVLEAAKLTKTLAEAEQLCRTVKEYADPS